MKALGLPRFFLSSWTSLAGAALALAGAASLVSACGDGDTRANRLDVAAPKASTESNDEWLRKQQRLTLKTETFDPATGAVTSVLQEEKTVGDALRYVQLACSAGAYNPCGQPNNCVPRTLLAIATAQSDPVRVLVPPATPFLPTTQRYVFDSVTTSNAAEFAAFAADTARDSLDSHWSRLTNPDFMCRYTATGPWAPGAPQAYAGAISEAYYLGRAAYDRAVEANLAVADAARSSTSSSSEAAQRSLLLEKFSRSAAAHLLVGGDDGLLGSKTQGYCVGPRLAPKAQSALSLLRDAAPSPAVVLDNTIGIQALLATSSTVGGPVRQRLGAFHKIKAFGWNPVTQSVALTPTQSLESYYDLDENDFVQARQYLQQEISVFNRSQVALSPAINGVRPYAGTAGTAVEDLPPGAWAARARYQVDPQASYGSWPMAPNRVALESNPPNMVNYHTPPLETFIGETYARINTLIRTTTDTFSSVNPPDPAHQMEVLGLLGSILMGKEYQGAVDVAMGLNRDYIYTTAHGYAPSDKVRVVVGEDGLRCAVQGNIEGADCSGAATALWGTGATSCTTSGQTLPCLTLALVSTAGGATDPKKFGTTSFVTQLTSFSSTVGTSLIDTKARLYFVKLKDPSLTEAPGNFELLAGGPVGVPASSTYIWGAAYPVIPSINARVAELLAPNRKNCAEQAVDCLGLHADARMPLEDELTDDSNGFENSWKHYLTLARQAADETAVLGREFRDAKLNQLQGAALAAQRQEDQRQAAGNALQEVQNLCGTALDTNKLLDFLSGSPLKKLDKVVTACTGPGLPSGSKCVVEPSIWTPANVAGSGLDTVQLKRLQDCMDDSSATFTNVTLGDREFCIWGLGNDVCPSWAASQCYVTYNSSTGCPVPTSVPSGGWGSTAKPVGYYVNPKGNVPNNNEACKLFRIARGKHDADSLAKMVAANVFNRDRFKDRLGQVGFKAEYGGFFTVTEDKTARFNSGAATRGRATGWPWVSSAAGCSMSDGGTGLFCQALGATPTAAQIGTLNARVYRAAYAATAALGEDFEVTYPTQYSPNVNACDGKTYQTEYHVATALTTNGSPIPVWTCDGQMGSDASGSINFARSYQPKTAGAWPVSWILPDGTSPPLVNTFYGQGAIFCGKWGGKQCGQGGCSNPTVDKDCSWGKLARSRIAAKESTGFAETPYTRDEIDNQIWGGLADASMFTTQGLIYEALAGTTDQSKVLFYGGSMNDYLSGEPRIAQMGEFSDSQRPYYRIPLDIGAVLDGQELLCELDSARQGAVGTATAGTLDLSTVDLAADAIKKLADTINEQASNLFFVQVPKVAADALGSAGPTGSFPGLSGDMGESVANLRQAFVSTQHAYPVISNSLRSIANELQSLKTQLEINEAQKSLVDWDTVSTVLAETMACAMATSDGAKVFTSFGSSAALQCAASAGQIVIAFKKAGLQKNIIAGQDQLANLAFIDRMSQDATALEQASISLMEARESINASLARIDGFKKQAKLSVARALYLASYQSQAQVAYDTSVGALTGVAQRRFDQALRNAKLMSWYAKRAIEQKLGLSLREMREDLPLVQAPALWEGEACTYSGFQDVVDPNAKPSGTVDVPADGWVAKYGDGFIGDYVTKLENFVESYRLTQNFHEGKDTAIVSLRDDVANVRAECSMPSRNLLRNAGELGSSEWAARNCDPVVTGGVSVTGVNCIAAALKVLPGTGMPDLAVKGLAGNQDSANGYVLTFGDGKLCDVNDSGGCGWKPGSALSQLVFLMPGRYRLSWFTRDNSAMTYTNGTKAAIAIIRGTGTLPNPVQVESLDGAAGSGSGFVFPRDSADPDWKRASFEFKVAVEGNYEVGFGVPTGARPTASQEVTIGAPMLEAMRDGRQFVLGSFEDTDADGKALIPNCEDTDGSVFRLKNWKRDCTHLCSDGSATNCQTGPKECFHEFTFAVSQAALQNGKLMSYSGFARGNFNYRIESLGLNFVGTSVRNCEDASLPSTCYNAGYVPYTLEHNGPFFVRNRAGDDFEALLFDGRIEHARGLALERYFTSPISSTDRALMTDYMRNEFTGRPLDGNFTLRVWDSEGVDFSSIQDVQLILNYRYWTAFN